MIEGLPKYKVTLYITHNEHKSYYESAVDYINRPEGIGMGGFDTNLWISREDFDAAIATDSIWEIQWYPITPVGYRVAYGSTFDNALTVAAKETNE